MPEVGCAVRRMAWPATVIALMSGAWLLFAWLRFGLPPSEAAVQAVRYVATPAAAFAMRADSEDVERITATYRVGDYPAPPHRFVYESSDSPVARALRETYALERVVESASTEYERMLALATWVSKQFDHGDDRLPGDSKVCDPIAVIESGRRGSKYWCEVAARLLAHAAISLGWPARVATGSTDGYTWEHAVAELWSSQFGKWIAIDADFNVVFEHEGVPLSAFELAHDAPRLKAEGRLHERLFTPSKPSLPLVDLLPLYAYVHVDQRSDWCSRILRRGSPVGGDLATWWTARPGFRPLLTQRRRVDHKAYFDWPVYRTVVRDVHWSAASEPASSRLVTFSAAVYGPEVTGFQVRTDSSDWMPAGDHRQIRVAVGKTDRFVEIRSVNRRGVSGAATRIEQPQASR